MEIPIKENKTEFDVFKDQMLLTLEKSQEAKTRLEQVARKLSNYNSGPKESVEEEPSTCFLHDVHTTKHKIDENLDEIHEILNNLQSIV
ncbi:MAG: hypothetical protein ACEPOW_13715 [Bacteroidales bacterium]